MLNPESIIKTKAPRAKSKKQTVSKEYNLEREFEDNKCYTNLYSDECNKFLLKKEVLERNELEKDPEANDYL